MNIKTITNEYFQKKLICQVGLLNSNTYTQSRQAMQSKREAKQVALNSLVDLNYSLKDCMTILDNYWPTKYIQLKEKFCIDNHSKNELRACTDSITYREVLINRQILACAYLEQQIQESNH
jgi:hypothetical protein